MRLSCGNDSFPLLQHDVSVELVARLGFDGYDLSLAGDRSQVRPAEVLADVARWVGILDERVRGRGLEFSDVFYIPHSSFDVMAPNHPDAAERERGRTEFRSMLDFTDRLGAPGMTMIPGVLWPHESHEASLRRAGEELVGRAAEARDRGIRLSVEPHVGSVCRTPADIWRLCELAPGLELTLDYTHYVCQGFEAGELEPLLAHTRHFHARGGNATSLQARLADATIDYERVLRAQAEVGYDGYVAVEYCWVAWERLNEVDVLTETVLLRDKLRRYADGSQLVEAD
jgi:sugar phosphate isomerase/epimerase